MAEELKHNNAQEAQTGLYEGPNWRDDPFENTPIVRFSKRFCHDNSKRPLPVIGPNDPEPQPPFRRLLCTGRTEVSIWDIVKNPALTTHWYTHPLFKHRPLAASFMSAITIVAYTLAFTAVWAAITVSLLDNLGYLLYSHHEFIAVSGIFIFFVGILTAILYAHNR